MKKNTRSHIPRIFLALLFPVLLFSASISAEDGLRIYDSTTVFRHFPVTLDENMHIKAYDSSQTVNRTFATKIIENPYLKVTLLPEYGGRILSIIYKPTGHELLYQNPVGTPFAIGDGSFYYNWMMVYGGIFPTFPEPEHGKTWCLPWESRIVEQTPEKIAFEMRFTDRIKPVPNKTPWRFVKGETGIACIATVTVYRDQSDVQLNLQLINNRSEEVNYEYWTCTTLAPGSEPGKTLCPSNTEIVAPIDKVKLRDDSWAWMGLAEEEIDFFSHTFKYKNLAKFESWKDMGIAYASPSMDKGWWGVINHDNEEGVLRVADNKKDTPGMKFWTWGYKGSAAANPENFHEQRRPYIELWAGHSREFFTNAVLKPDQRKGWNEFYLPTAGLSKITAANRNGAVFLNYTPDNTGKKLRFTASVFLTRPDKPTYLTLSVNGKKRTSLLTRTFTPNPKTADEFEVEYSRDRLPADAASFGLRLGTPEGEPLIAAEIPIDKNRFKKN